MSVSQNKIHWGPSVRIFPLKMIECDCVFRASVLSPVKIYGIRVVFACWTCCERGKDIGPCSVAGKSGRFYFKRKCCGSHSVTFPLFYLQEEWFYLQGNFIMKEILWIDNFVVSLSSALLWFHLLVIFISLGTFTRIIVSPDGISAFLQNSRACKPENRLSKNLIEWNELWKTVLTQVEWIMGPSFTDKHSWTLCYCIMHKNLNQFHLTVFWRINCFYVVECTF